MTDTTAPWLELVSIALGDLAYPYFGDWLRAAAAGDTLSERVALGHELLKLFRRRQVEDRKRAEERSHPYWNW